MPRTIGMATICKRAVYISMSVPGARGFLCLQGGEGRVTGWTGLVAPLLDIFGRIDAHIMLETERGRILARVITEQVGGEATGKN